MSRARLYDQLTSEYGEGFSDDAANYALENLNADYNYNALQKHNHMWILSTYRGQDYMTS